MMNGSSTEARTWFEESSHKSQTNGERFVCLDDIPLDVIEEHRKKLDELKAKQDTRLNQIGYQTLLRSARVRRGSSRAVWVEMTKDW